MTLSDLAHRRIALGSGIFLLLALVLWNAGVTADAYVTFRVIDNALHGYGLRWNIHERVQAYTHPLWMLMELSFTALFSNSFMVAILLGVACTLESIFIVLRTFAHGWRQGLCLFILPLCASTAIVMFSTSGLENALTHLLFAAFGWSLLCAPARWRVFAMSLTISLSLVNRLDLAIFYAPILFYLIIVKRREVRLLPWFLGALPLFSWLGFSLFYYGFIFPNTKYAKLNANIPFNEYVQQGLHYVGNLMVGDFVLIPWLAGVAVIAPFCYLCSAGARRLISPEMFCIALGVLCYGIYIVCIGGDYISGRYWTLPIFASVWWVYGVFGDRFSERVCAAIALALLALTLNAPNYRTVRHYCHQCVDNIMLDKGRLSLRDYVTGRIILPEVKRNEPFRVNQTSVSAIMAYQDGPQSITIDTVGLSDALIARLPSDDHTLHMAGHLHHRIPAGYVYAVAIGSTQQMHPMLREYYRKLSLIISGDLWDMNRLATIVRFNLGSYDPWLAAYAHDAKLTP